MSWHDMGPTPGDFVVKRIEHEKGKNTRAQLDHCFEIQPVNCYEKGKCLIGGPDGQESPHFATARVPWSEHAEADAHLYSAARALLDAADKALEWMSANPPATGWGTLDHGADTDRKEIIAELSVAIGKAKAGAL